MRTAWAGTTASQGPACGSSKLNQRARNEPRRRLLRDEGHLITYDARGESEYTLAPVTDIDKELAAYDQMRPDLEAHHMGEWVLVRGSELVSTYSSFEDAAKDAVTRFGRGPYLIRQVGAPAINLSASVAYFQHGSD